MWHWSADRPGHEARTWARGTARGAPGACTARRPSSTLRKLACRASPGRTPTTSAGARVSSTRAARNCGLLLRGRSYLKEDPRENTRRSVRDLRAPAHDVRDASVSQRAAESVAVAPVEENKLERAAARGGVRAQQVRQKLRRVDGLDVAAGLREAERPRTVRGWRVGVAAEEKAARRPVEQSHLRAGRAALGEAPTERGSGRR